ncbi:MAG TPA: hypothetical protein PLG28_02270 [Bacillota bacterium]|nr:hypothetical protein [Candidatus Fermentithermobacillaceae bacterium]HOB30342.1 hypothetical protein [Bacillota bacterium]HOK64409.1 hypothetical protein [Bacillota bacterium]HPP60545.1 hypothetical protein [Bacillota bacterium]HPZ78771.1 hypothetical protein [Bacillota bacterium]
MVLRFAAYYRETSGLNMPKICARYAQGVRKVRKRHAGGMKNACQNLPDTVLMHTYWDGLSGKKRGIGVLG